MRIWKATPGDQAAILQLFATAEMPVPADQFAGYLALAEDTLPGMYLVAEDEKPVLAIEVRHLRKDICVGKLASIYSEESEDFTYYFQQFMTMLVRRYKSSKIKSLFLRTASDQIVKNALAHGFTIFNEQLLYRKKDGRVPEAQGLPVTIRPYEVGDMDGLIGIEQAIFMPEVWNDRDTFTEMLNTPASMLSVAVFHGQLVGYNYNRILENGTGHLVRLGVHEDYQGLGIGKQFLQKSIEWFLTAGAAEMMLYVRQENIGARALYEKSGFNKEGLEYLLLYEEEGGK